MLYEVITPFRLLQRQHQRDPAGLSAGAEAVEGPQLALTKERVSKGISTAQASLQEALESLKFAQEDAALQADRVQKEIERAQANYQAARAKVVEARANMANAQKA